MVTSRQDARGVSVVVFIEIRTDGSIYLFGAAMLIGGAESFLSDLKYSAN